MRAVTFSFVDQSSSRGLKKFGEKIPTSPISPEVIQTLLLWTMEWICNSNIMARLKGSEIMLQNNVQYYNVVHLYRFME